jgi:hypothetical protein
VLIHGDIHPWHLLAARDGLDVLLEYGDPTHRCATLDELERAIFPIGLE